VEQQGVSPTPAGSDPAERPPDAGEVAEFRLVLGILRQPRYAGYVANELTANHFLNGACRALFVALTKEQPRKRGGFNLRRVSEFLAWNGSLSAFGGLDGLESLSNVARERGPSDIGELLAVVRELQSRDLIRGLLDLAAEISKRAPSLAPDKAGHFLGRCRRTIERLEKAALHLDVPDHDPGDDGPEPDEWVSGGEPMTDAQARYLQYLCEKTSEPFDPDLSKADASVRINQLKTLLIDIQKAEAAAKPVFLSASAIGRAFVPSLQTFAINQFLLELGYVTLVENGQVAPTSKAEGDYRWRGQGGPHPWLEWQVPVCDAICAAALASPTGLFFQRPDGRIGRRKTDPAT
jgi:hypothetical protein